ncbi:unnamed protein product [Orchesella dallaii]|uniref:O-acyltransferase WSD1 C-terminal domain-containing protein n=1 Tax=Orchesella dallaii TaxID=48710 RepID=A0ABP1RYE8_9HEXA
MSFTTTAKKFLGGIVVIVIYLGFTILCIPIFIYRFVIFLWVKCLYKNKFGNLVSPYSAPMATELIPSKEVYPPRLSICVQCVVDGKVTVEEVEESINRRWLQNNSSYPELKQYAVPFMGFMFWKHDPNFNLKNHLKSHIIPVTSDKNQIDVEQENREFLEKLLNKPFNPERSPWEFYIVNNYRNEQFKDSRVNEEMTLIVFRFHHCLGDGFSILRAIVEELLETPLSTLALPTPKMVFGLASLKKRLKFVFTALLRIPYDAGSFIGLAFYPKTPLYTTDEKRKCELLYERNELMPIHRIKDIKKKLGVSFSGVLLAAISAAVAKSVHKLQSKKGGNSKDIEGTPFGITLPIPTNSSKLRNSWAGTYLELPTKLELGSMERLRDVEKELQRAKTNTLPFLWRIYWKTAGMLFSNMSKSLTKNYLLPAGFSSFPGPGINISVKGKNVLMVDALGGIHNGIAGVGFMILSFGSVIRVSAMAVDGTMNREEVKEILGYVNEEFDNLEKLSLSMTSQENDVSEEKKGFLV